LTTTLVLGWGMNPEASLVELANVAAMVGTRISPQGLDARLQSPGAAALLADVLAGVLAQRLPGAASTLPILQRFAAVTLIDSTTVVLPDELRERWPGSGGSSPRNTQAALKLGIGLDLGTGALIAPSVTPGRVQDRALPVQHAPVIRNSVRILDRGFWSLPRFSEICGAGGHFISYLQVQTGLLATETRERIDLMAWLDDPGVTDQVRERPVLLGVTARLPVRLIAIRQSAEVTARRRRTLIKQARRKGRSPNVAALERAGWNLLVTDLGPADLSVDEAIALLDARWQIELLFKQWKSLQHLARSRSAKPGRRYCEVLAKAIACLLLHSLLNLGWARPQHSFTHDATLVRHYLAPIVLLLDDPFALRTWLARLTAALHRATGVRRRRDRPATFQILESLPLFP